MVRTKSDEKRNAILQAATQVIAAQGIGAPTALIAKRAGISTGALFTYFETKSELLNQLYLDLKSQSAAAATDGLPVRQAPRKQLQHVWNRWMAWAESCPEQRLAMTFLGACSEVTPRSHEAGGAFYADLIALLDRCRAGGPLQDAPLDFVGSLIIGLVDATIAYASRNPAGRESQSAAGFDALWRMLT